MSGRARWLGLYGGLVDFFGGAERAATWRWAAHNAREDARRVCWCGEIGVHRIETKYSEIAVGRTRPIEWVCEEHQACGRNTPGMWAVFEEWGWMGKP